MKNKSMNIKKHLMLLASVVLLSSVACQMQVEVSDENMHQPNSLIGNDSILIGKSIDYKNLQIIPIIAKKPSDNHTYMILSEVIKNKDVVVEETGNVNQLSISNNTDDYIFILAGDIVKGGRQDRTIGNDIIIPPHTKHAPLESFCVESGRWQQRESEEVKEFSDNTKMLASRDLKLASRYEKDQSKVWEKVSEKQEKLNKNLGDMKGEEVNVRSDKSGTSLQLTLESEELAVVTREYNQNLKLSDLPVNTIGFAYAINGKLYGIDIYQNSDLFIKLKPKLFESVIAEAISEYEKDSSFVSADNKLVNEIMQKLSKAEVKESGVNEHTLERMSKADDGVLFETIDKTQGQKWVRKNYIIKENMDEMSEKENQRMNNSR